MLNERNGSLKLLIHLVHMVCVFLTCVFLPRYQETPRLLFYLVLQIKRKVGISVKQEGKRVIHESEDWIMEMLCDL